MDFKLQLTGLAASLALTNQSCLGDALALGYTEKRRQIEAAETQ